MKSRNLFFRTSAWVLIGTSLAYPAHATGSVGADVSADVAIGSSGASISADVGVGTGHTSATGSADVSIGGNSSHGKSDSQGKQSGISTGVGISINSPNENDSDATAGGSVSAAAGAQSSTGGSTKRKPNASENVTLTGSAALHAIEVNTALIGLPVYSSDKVYIGQIIQVTADDRVQISTTEEGTLELDNAVSKITTDKVLLRVTAQVLSPWLDDNFARLSVQ